MNTQLRWASALTVCLGLLLADQAQAQYQRNYSTANAAAALAGESLASYNSYENSYNTDFSDVGECCDNYCSSCNAGSICGCAGQFFVGADYLHVRSTFSEATAFVVQEGDTPLSGSLLSPPITQTFHELDYDYESSYRIYGGYRWCECGGEIRFAFTQFNSGAEANSGPVPIPTTGIGGRTTYFLYPGELPAVIPGDRINVTSDVDAKIFDLGFAKTIPLGPPACESCDTCCDPCCNDACCNNCCRCPAWDIKWSAGIRFADVSWNRLADLQSLDQTRDATYRSTTMDFEGGGARVGLEGTRYIGRNQRFAVFAKSDISILLGDVSIEHITDSTLTSGIDILTRYKSTQLIPVLDIEAGATVYLTNCLSVSGGYLFSAWHDLGMRDTFDVLEGNGPTFDDANILGFDGFFARTEFSF